MKILPAVISLFLVGFVRAQPLDKSTFIPIRSQADLLNGGESRIVGGEAAKQGEIPYQAQVNIISFDLNMYFCGGSLISPRHVLTAAHCVERGFLFQIKLGGVKLDVESEPGTVFVSTDKSVYHESYNGVVHNDIGIITLKEDVVLSDTIQTIRLPKRSDLNDPLVNVKVNVSGHGLISDDSGLSSTLQHVELTTISNERCEAVYGANVIIPSIICAVGNPHHSVCHGDSGGPLYRLEEDGVPTHVGIASFVAQAGCAEGYPSGYTRTAHYLDFIHKHTGLAIRD